MKYVIIRADMGDNMERELPILFPNDLSHDQVARAILATCPEARDGRVVSAGLVNSFDVAVTPSGHSATLKLAPRDEDVRIIAMCDYGGHIIDKEQ